MENIILYYINNKTDYDKIDKFLSSISEDCLQTINSNATLTNFLLCAYVKINKFYFNDALNVRGIVKHSDLDLPDENIGLMNHLYLENIQQSIITFKSYAEIQNDYNEIVLINNKLLVKGYIKNVFVFKDFTHFCLFLLEHECVHNLLQQRPEIGHGQTFWTLFENYSGEHPFAYLGYHVCMKIDQFVLGEETFYDIFVRGEFTKDNKSVFDEAFEEAWGDYIPIDSQEYVKGRILAYYDTIARFGTVNI